jgi:uncharacterized protein YcsI (UPF0317 family)
VAFLIGCSFSYDGAFQEAGIPLRSAEQGKNVPMYETNVPCRPAGKFHGNLVVSMKPIPALQVSKEVEITSKYQHAHGGPVCVGCPSALGIADVNRPDWGDAIEIKSDGSPSSMLAVSHRKPFFVRVVSPLPLRMWPDTCL